MDLFSKRRMAIADPGMLGPMRQSHVRSKLARCSSIAAVLLGIAFGLSFTVAPSTATRPRAK